jgi:UDP-3-O-[3-hydroxymyristoyl] glucosamine N-acyltransferase
VLLISGGSGSTGDIMVGSKVTITGTQGADKSVTVNEIRVVAVPKTKK